MKFIVDTLDFQGITFIVQKIIHQLKQLSERIDSLQINKIIEFKLFVVDIWIKCLFQLIVLFIKLQTNQIFVQNL